MKFNKFYSFFFPILSGILVAFSSPQYGQFYLNIFGFSFLSYFFLTRNYKTKIKTFALYFALFESTIRVIIFPWFFSTINNHVTSNIFYTIILLLFILLIFSSISFLYGFLYGFLRSKISNNLNTQAILLFIFYIFWDMTTLRIFPWNMAMTTIYNKYLFASVYYLTPIGISTCLSALWVLLSFFYIKFYKKINYLFLCIHLLTY